MNLKAFPFERLALISLGFGRGAQVVKTSLLEVNLLRRNLFFHLARFRPEDAAKTLDLFKKTKTFSTMLY